MENHKRKYFSSETETLGVYAEVAVLARIALPLNYILSQVGNARRCTV